MAISKATSSQSQLCLSQPQKPSKPLWVALLCSTHLLLPWLQPKLPMVQSVGITPWNTGDGFGSCMFCNDFSSTWALQPFLCQTWLLSLLADTYLPWNSFSSYHTCKIPSLLALKACLKSLLQLSFCLLDFILRHTGDGCFYTPIVCPHFHLLHDPKSCPSCLEMSQLSWNAVFQTHSAWGRQLVWKITAQSNLLRVISNQNEHLTMSRVRKFR